MAVKGAAEQRNDRLEIFAPPKMVDLGRKHKPAKFGLQTHIVGTARAKDLILDTRVGLQGSGPGRVHWYAGVRPDYWDQLTSEVKIPQGPKRRMTWTKKGGQRNEALDCEVYALHAARSQKTHLLREAHWVAIEQRLRQRSLLELPADRDQAVTDTAPEADQVQPVDQSAQQPQAEAPSAAVPNTTPAPPQTPAAPRKPVRRGGPARGSGGFVNQW